MWTKEAEYILSQISEKSYNMSNTHKKNHRRHKETQKYFKIPVIILSGLNSVFSVGLTDFLEQPTISIINCLISLCCGIIASIEIYLKLSEAIQKEYEVSKAYSLLHIELSKVLLLKPKDRGTDGIEYLDNVYKRYTRLIQKSQIIIGEIMRHDIKVPMEIELQPINEITEEV